MSDSEDDGVLFGGSIDMDGLGEAMSEAIENEGGATESAVASEVLDVLHRLEKGLLEELTDDPHEATAGAEAAEGDGEDEDRGEGGGACALRHRVRVSDSSNRRTTSFSPAIKQLG